MSKKPTPSTPAPASKSGMEELQEIMQAAARSLEVQKSVDATIERAGSKIVLPAQPHPMGTREAIQVLERIYEDENQEMEVSEIISGFPLDGAVAFTKAMSRKYGWAQSRSASISTFFGKMEVPPQLKSVRIGPKPGDVMTVALGNYSLPGFENPINVHPCSDPAHGGVGLGLHIMATVKKREREALITLIEEARHILATESIYQGKAIRLSVDRNGKFNETVEPDFIEVDHVNPDDLILPRNTEQLVETALFVPVKYTDAVLANKIPLKRGVLLAGPYGTGKTMTATVASKVCVENGWTFILLTDVKGLEKTLGLAKRYQPCMVFAEDIDRIMSTRDEAANNLLNTIDGVLSKDARVITVLTTNFVDKLDKAMLRPGRLDAVINISAPDAEACQRLVRLYARGLLKDGETLARIGAELAGNIPATIREVVERSKLAMIGRNDIQIVEEDLLIAARGMKEHMALLQPPASDARSDAHKLGDALAKLVKDNALNGSQDKIDFVKNGVAALMEEAGVEV